MESNHSATFSGQRQCGNGDLIIFVCHMILQDHLSKEPWKITFLPSLVTIGTLVVEI